MIAVVSQDTYLFHGTVEENLRLGRPDAAQADLIAAATAANAHGFIAALPNGYQTVIGERGTQLSGGQRQRLAIARALLRDSPILILDEALSSVDTENEAIIQQALDRLMQGRTTLILAHRLSSVIAADRILVLNDGVVVAVRRAPRPDRPTRPLPRFDGPATRRTRRHHRPLARRRGRPARCPRRRAAHRDVPGRAHTSFGRSPGGAMIASLSEDAAQVTWPATIRTLLRVVRPYRGQLAITVATGIGRVVAFIGVSVLGALVLAAVRNGAPTGLLIAALLVTAPLAGILHWLESWIAHAMAYALLADMRIDLFRKLDALAPAYLLRRRSGDLVALATQDVETVEYFFAHTIAPAIVAVLVPVSVIVAMAWIAWPLALGLAPFLLYAAASPVLGRQRIDRLGSAARGALGLIGAYSTETIQGLAELVMFGAARRRRDGFMAAVRTYQSLRLSLLADLSFQAAALDAATGLGGLAVAAPGAVLVTHGMLAPTTLPLLVLISVAAFLPVSEIAQVGRQLADTIASTRRLAVVQAEPVLITDGPSQPAGGSGVIFDDVSFRYPARASAGALGHVVRGSAGATVALVGPSGAGKTTVASLLLRFWDPTHGSIRFGGIDLRDLALDGLRGSIALVAQDTYLFNDTLEANVRLARPDASPEQIALALSRRRAGRVRLRASPRASPPASASAASNSPAVSASASPSPEPS